MYIDGKKGDNEETKLYDVYIGIAKGVIINKATGSVGNDYIVGNAADNSLSGGLGIDILDGGIGVDAYMFSGSFDFDTVLDSDALGSIVLNGQPITTINRTQNLNEWSTTLDGKEVILSFNDVGADNVEKQDGIGTMTIHYKGVTRDFISIENFDTSKLYTNEGYLGIKVASQEVSLVQGVAEHAFSTMTRAMTFAASSPSVIVETGTRLYTVFLEQAAHAGDTVSVGISGAAASAFNLAGNTVNFNLHEGQTFVSFLLTPGDVSADLSGQLVATYVPALGSQSATSNRVDILVRDTQNDLQVALPNSIAYNGFYGSEAPREVNFIGGTKSSSFIGSAYGDTIITDEGDLSYVLSQGGNDFVQGGLGRDFIRTGSALDVDADVAAGGVDSDILLGGGGDDFLLGNIANDDYGTTTAQSGERGDFISGENGNDALFGSNRQDVVLGGAADDMLDTGAGNDLLLGDGAYTPSVPITKQGFGGVTTTLSWYYSERYGDFTSTHDSADLYAGREVLLPSGAAFEWSWSMSMETGDFTLTSGTSWVSQTRAVAEGGNDMLFGGAGNDWMAGQAKDDLLNGGAGDDMLYGDDVVASATDGKDTLYAGAGADVLFGGGGDDYLNATENDNAADYLMGGAGDDELEGGTGYDELYGEAGNDMLVGGDMACYLDGGEGDDLMMGGADSNDYLDGGAGSDYLLGSLGQDQLTGGLDDDVFYFTSDLLEAANDVSEILDAENADCLLLDGDELETQTWSAMAGGIWWNDSGTVRLSLADGTLTIRPMDADGTLQGAILVRNFSNGVLGLTLPEYNPEEPENHAPEAQDMMEAQLGRTGELFSVVLPETLFVDQDGDALSFAVTAADDSPLPDWLSFDAETRTLSGTPPEDAAGVLNLKVTASDPGRKTASQDFELTVSDNHAPGIVLTITEGVATENVKFSWHLPEQAFSDPDQDALSFNFTLPDGAPLPDWLHYDANSHVLSGTPDASVGDRFVVRLVATDPEGLSASQDVIFNVLEGYNEIVGTAASQGLSGTVGNDYIKGLGGNDSLFGGSGNDKLEGGVGTDSMVGGEGDDIYLFARGDGKDRVVESAGNDSLRFGESIDFDQLWLSRSGSHLLISVIGTPDTVTVFNWYSSSGAQRVEHIEAGGAVLESEDVQALVDIMDDYSQPLIGTLELGAPYADVLEAINEQWQGA